MFYLQKGHKFPWVKKSPFFLSRFEKTSQQQSCAKLRTSVTCFLILKAAKALQSFFTFYSHRTTQAKSWLDYSALITKLTPTKGAVVPGTYVHISLNYNTKYQNAIWSCCRSNIPLWQDLWSMNRYHSNAWTASCVMDTRLCMYLSHTLRSFRVDCTWDK